MYSDIKQNIFSQNVWGVKSSTRWQNIQFVSVLTCKRCEPSSLAMISTGLNSADCPRPSHGPAETQRRETVRDRDSQRQSETDRDKFWNSRMRKCENIWGDLQLSPCCSRCPDEPLQTRLCPSIFRLGDIFKVLLFFSSAVDLNWRSQDLIEVSLQWV